MASASTQKRYGALRKFAMPHLHETPARVILTQGPCVLCAGAWDEPFLILPGGYVEDDDAHALEGLRREVEEEVGVRLAAVLKLTVLANEWMRGEDVVHEKMHLYAATASGPIGGGPFVRSPEAHTVLRWASVDDLAAGLVRLQPTALLPWVLRCMGRA